MVRAGADSVTATGIVIRKGQYVTRSLLRRVELETPRTLADYEGFAHLAPAVHELRSEATAVLPRLRGRTVWMINSTSEGGGVAEMLLQLVPLLRDLGVRTDWMVIGSWGRGCLHWAEAVSVCVWRRDPARRSWA